MCDGSEFVVFYLDSVPFPVDHSFKGCCHIGHEGVQGPQGINPLFKTKNLDENKWSDN